MEKVRRDRRGGREGDTVASSAAGRDRSWTVGSPEEDAFAPKGKSSLLYVLQPVLPNPGCCPSRCLSPPVSRLHCARVYLTLISFARLQTNFRDGPGKVYMTHATKGIYRFIMQDFIRVRS